MNERTYRNKTLRQNSHRKINVRGCVLLKDSRNILEVDEGRTSSNGLRNKKTKDCMCQQKKEDDVDACIQRLKGVRGVMVIVVRNGHDDTI